MRSGALIPTNSQRPARILRRLASAVALNVEPPGSQPMTTSTLPAHHSASVRPRPNCLRAEVGALGTETTVIVRRKTSLPSAADEEDLRCLSQAMSWYARLMSLSRIGMGGGALSVI